jgi:hypothetical protein
MTHIEGCKKVYQFVVGMPEGKWEVGINERIILKCIMERYVRGFRVE